MHHGDTPVQHWRRAAARRERENVFPCSRQLVPGGYQTIRGGTGGPAFSTWLSKLSKLSSPVVLLSQPCRMTVAKTVMTAVVQPVERCRVLCDRYYVYVLSFTVALSQLSTVAAVAAVTAVIAVAAVRTLGVRAP